MAARTVPPHAKGWWRHTHGSFRRLLLCGVVAALPALAYAAEAPAPQPAGTTPTTTPKRLPSGPEQRQAKMTSRWVMSLALGQDGSGWVGTEDDGVWRYDPSVTDGKPWTRYSTQEGLGDDNGYAVACDQQGRIWVGHLNHGVSVFNGQQWKNYDVVTGPLGERVFCISVCPTDGDVWIGTDAGISRYKVKADTWQYYTRAEGLPSDQISAIAFDKAGNAYVGTQCDGLAIAQASDQYTKWRQVDGPLKPLLQHAGEGLPSALINAVLVAHDGTVYVGTPHGLGFSHDGGQSWRYLRGLDWLAKAQGQYPTPKVDDAAPGALLEDYVTCLAEDEAGELWIGHWHKGGYEVWDIARGQRVHTSEQDPGKRDSGDYVRAFLLWAGAAPGKNVWIARYMDGTRPEVVPGLTLLTQNVGLPSNIKKGIQAALPSNAASPSDAALASKLQQVQALTTPMPNESGTYLSEDWNTQGDWVKHYGRRYAVLCGTQGDSDDVITIVPAGPEQYHVGSGMGPHHLADDLIRRWIHWSQTDNPKSLWDLERGYRRQAEWDDHGEEYPWEYEGPDLWTRVQIPSGIHQISFYFFNKDGHDTTARYRDYLVELKRYAEMDQAAEEPPLARCRVRDFWGGVYKSFMVRGPALYWIKIDRNNSHNTICSGVFLDRFVGPPAPYDDNLLPYMGRTRYDAPAIPRLTAQQMESFRSALGLWRETEMAVDRAGIEKLLAISRLLAYRRALSNGAPAGLQTRWRWFNHIWVKSDRQDFSRAVEESWQEYLLMNPRVSDQLDAERKKALATLSHMSTANIEHPGGPMNN